MDLYEVMMEAFRMKVMQALPHDVAFLACAPYFGTFLIGLLALIISMINNK